jgi:hypothetical protein
MERATTMWRRPRGVATSAPSRLPCPGCDGTVSRLPGDPPAGYRCRVGHTYDPDALLVAGLVTAMATLFEARKRALQMRSVRLRQLALRSHALWVLELAAVAREQGEPDVAADLEASARRCAGGRRLARRAP